MTRKLQFLLPILIASLRNSPSTLLQHLRDLLEPNRLQRAALLLFVGILALPLAAAQGDDGPGRARFSWDPVEDPIVSGYKVHWGTTSGAYTRTADAGNATDLIVTAFSEGVEYFAAVTAYSDAGEESDYSTEIAFVYDTSELDITITSQPEPQVVAAGQTASFTVTATGSGTLTYQWQKDGTPIPDATFATHTIASAVVADAGSYTVAVSNAAGSTTSDAAVLIVNPATPVILEIPVASTLSYGQTLAEATLSGGLASVPGVFAFANPSTVPNAGTANQTVVFTPDDPANYTTATVEMGVTVNPATPVILELPMAANIILGQTLAEATLSGGAASVPGTFAYANPLSVPALGVSSHPVIFTAADAANHNTVTVQVKVKVLRKSNTSSLTVSQDYDSWISNFAWTEGASAPGDDPDGDGVTNLMEYALADGQPDFSDRQILPVLSIMADADQQYLAMTVRKNPYAIDISLLVEVSGDLADWHAGAGHTVVMKDTADTLIVRDNTPMSDSFSRFLRLRVTAEQP